ncbi:9785_t:CDS:2 [Entrophospora sp. SA101]|nr:9785_t:CDS:2 [Entrophospora sp. SA101]
MFKKVMFIGLGNHKYLKTRHSIGMQVMDHIADLKNLTWFKDASFPGEFAKTIIYAEPKSSKLINNNKLKKSKKSISPTTIASVGIENSPKSSSSLDQSNNNYIPIEIVLFKPLLLMNISGKCIAKAVKHFGMSPSNIIVIHDDMERELGKISLKFGGMDIMELNQSFDVFRLRLRVGIGRPKTYDDDRDPENVQKYVLGCLTLEETKIFKNEIFSKCHDTLIECNASISRNCTNLSLALSAALTIISAASTFPLQNNRCFLKI